MKNLFLILTAVKTWKIAHISWKMKFLSIFFLSIYSPPTRDNVKLQQIMSNYDIFRQFPVIFRHCCDVKPTISDAIPTFLTSNYVRLRQITSDYVILRQLTRGTTFYVAVIWRCLLFPFFFLSFLISFLLSFFRYFLTIFIFMRVLLLDCLLHV